MKFSGLKPDVAKLVECPNVVAKVGGIQMVVNGYGWHEREKPPTSDELLAANKDWYNYIIDPSLDQTAACLKVIFQLISYPALILSSGISSKNSPPDFQRTKRAAMFHGWRCVSTVYQEFEKLG